ncbi:OsmC family protein [Aquihabitans sp. G128]|uniref:OsmC family protein n=1 Tax=Aquihabitans sp. G128 TaxID=2849779 RepID=UPI001C219EB6|nr:OsmC family protein [Aquihabitans sp. G128]QXC62921.1 OsmC family protein [Aquihabitans sp. G128]
MPTRNADATWNGALRDGNGSFKTSSGAVEGAYSFSSRFEDGSGTNPEELIAAAHAACFSMALANELGSAGHVPESVSTTAKVHLEKAEGGFAIPKIELITRAKVDGLDDAEFQEIATATSKACPVSKALAAIEITLDASLA